MLLKKFVEKKFSEKSCCRSINCNLVLTLEICVKENVQRRLFRDRPVARTDECQYNVNKKKCEVGK